MAIIIDGSESGISVTNIIRRIEFLLADSGNVRWTTPELFDWINDAAVAVVRELPTSRAVTQDISLVAGALQSLNSNDAVMLLLDIPRNKKADGTIGRAIRIADRQLLDDQEPDWYLNDQSEKILHYCYDERAPRTFYVYPPAVEGTIVEALYSERPPKIDSTDDAIDMRPQYFEAIVNYVCYRCLSRDSEDGISAQARDYYTAFRTVLGLDAQVEGTVTPNGASQ